MAQGQWRTGVPPKNPQYPVGYGQPGRITTQAYPTNHEQAGRALQNAQLHPANYGQAGSAPQNTQAYISNYEQAGWPPQNLKSYPAGYGEAGRAPQNPQPYPANYSQAGEGQPNPELYPANYRSAGETPPNPQTSAATTGQAVGPAQNRQNYRNPITVFFTVLFKVSAIVFYIFCGWLTSSFVIHFVIVSLLMAFDFWTVKNVSGRILVGMRWWNEVDEQGQSVWRFESLEQEALARMNPNDSWMFWSSLYTTCAVWTLFGVIAILKLSLDYFLLDCISLSLCAANIVGYTKCRKDAKQKLQAFAESAVAAGMREVVTGGITRGLQKTFGI